MTGPVVTSAGSSGGAQPPPGPHKLPSQCELALPAARGRGRPPRKSRGLVKGEHIAAHVVTNGKIKLRFDQDGHTWKAIGQHAMWYDIAVRIHTRDCCEPFHHTWKDVPAQQKAQMQECLLDWFDIEIDQVFQSVLERDATKCYKNWKNDLATWFRGFDTVEEARANPHPTIRDASHWERCCDRISSPEFQKVSGRNKANRQKQKFTSFHGRRSYAQHRAKRRALGRHRGHITEIDPILPQASQQVALGLSFAQQVAYEDRILQRIEATQQQLIDDIRQLTDVIRQLTDVVGQLAPHIHLPLPDASPNASIPSSSSATNDPNNDAINLGN